MFNDTQICEMGVVITCKDIVCTFNIDIDIFNVTVGIRYSTSYEYSHG